jgi:exonuclease SbcC
MIRSLKIKNFQSHKDTLLEFDEGVSAIIGPSDSGKTAIFRALRWVIENRPSGKSFHSWWAGDPEITVGLSEGIEITRSRRKDVNLYRMFEDDDERGNPPQELEFKAFGQRVPEEVQRALNLSPINFQWQMDASFLLSQGSGEVSRYLNNVVNLESIDTTQANIERRLRREKAEVERAKSSIEDYEKRIADYDWLAEAEEELLELEGLEEETRKTMFQLTALSDLLHSLRTCERRLAKAQSVTGLRGELEGLLELQEEIEGLDDEIAELEYVVDEVAKIEEELELASVVVGLRGELEELLAVQNEIEGLNKSILFLRGDVNNLADKEAMLRATEKELKRLRSEYDALMPDVCPLCEQPIKKTKRKRGN